MDSKTKFVMDLVQTEIKSHPEYAAFQKCYSNLMNFTLGLLKYYFENINKQTKLYQDDVQIVIENDPTFDLPVLYLERPSESKTRIEYIVFNADVEIFNEHIKDNAIIEIEDEEGFIQRLIPNASVYITLLENLTEAIIPGKVDQWSNQVEISFDGNMSIPLYMKRHLNMKIHNFLEDTRLLSIHHIFDVDGVFESKNKLFLSLTLEGFKDKSFDAHIDLSTIKWDSMPRIVSQTATDLSCFYVDKGFFIYLKKGNVIPFLQPSNQVKFIAKLDWRFPLPKDFNLKLRQALPDAIFNNLSKLELVYTPFK